MNRVNQFFNMIGSGQEYLSKQKKFYMSIFTILLIGYGILLIKPEVVNLEIILTLIIAIIPVIAVTSAAIDCITLKGNNFYKKIITRAGIYLSVYFVLNVIQNNFF